MLSVVLLVSKLFYVKLYRLRYLLKKGKLPNSHHAVSSTFAVIVCHLHVSKRYNYRTVTLYGLFLLASELLAYYKQGNEPFAAINPIHSKCSYLIRLSYSNIARHIFV